MRSEELKSCEYLIHFLSNTDKKSWKTYEKALENAKFGRTLQDLTTSKGSAKVQMTANSASFCKNMFDYVSSNKILF